VGGRPRRQRLATVPMLVIFFLGQRYFVEGIAATGRKG
jgi:multiple sugar transport system permease protein